jgi:hypothetical protein
MQIKKKTNNNRTNIKVTKIEVWWQISSEDVFVSCKYKSSIVRVVVSTEPEAYLASDWLRHLVASFQELLHWEVTIVVNNVTQVVLNKCLNFSECSSLFRRRHFQLGNIYVENNNVTIGQSSFCLEERKSNCTKEIIFSGTTMSQFWINLFVYYCIFNLIYLVNEDCPFKGKLKLYMCT